MKLLIKVSKICSIGVFYSRNTMAGMNMCFCPENLLAVVLIFVQFYRSTLKEHKIFQVRRSFMYPFIPFLINSLTCKFQNGPTKVIVEKIVT
jgi:hypothetical protein